MKRLSIIFYILLFQLSWGNANNHSLSKYRFKYLTMKDGLSNYKVNAVCKDSNGFMWFGTNEGLNRYDGYNFKIYNSDLEDSTCLGSNSIRKIINKSKDELIIATDYGAYIYNSRRDEFSAINCNGDENCKELTWSVCIDDFGTIWLGTLNGLFYKTNDSKYAINFSDSNTWFNNYYVREVEVLSNNKLYIGTKYDGIIIYDIITGEYIHHKHEPGNLESISGNWIEAIYEDSKHNIWIGTNDNGLNKYTPETKTFEHHLVRGARAHSYRVRDIQEDCFGRLWMGASVGLYLKENADSLFTKYASIHDVTSTLFSHSVYDVFIDNNDMLWLGTYSGGVNYCDMHQKDFRNFEFRKEDNRFLNDRVIYGICEDKEHLWIGTEKGGLNKYDKKTGRFTYYNLPKNGVRSNNIKVLIQDSEKDLWIGTYRGGFVHFDKETTIFTPYTNNPLDSNSLVNNMVYALCFDTDSNLWVGTRNGIDKFNPKTKKFTHYESVLSNSNKQTSQIAYEIFIDSENNIWMGGSILGLFLLDKEEDIFKPYHDIFHSTAINAIIEDSNGKIWAGGSHGLYYIDDEKDTIIQYTKKNGLPINTIFSIEQDKKGNLWMSTTYGISKFENAISQPYLPKFINYKNNDGISIEQFILNPNNTHISDELFFGGVNGFVSFHPDHIAQNPIKPKVVLTNLTVFNEETQIGEAYKGEVILNESITTQKEIRLTYKHKIFTIEFASLHFSNPIKNKYKYRLEGFEDDWNYTSANKRYATYSNLKGGKYKFVVYGSNNDGIWSAIPAELMIHIIPPFWQTIWFFLLASIFSLFFIILMIRFRTVNLNKQNQSLEKAKAKAEESDRLKSAFLANMSHEIRTPMNSILGFSNFLIEEEDKNLQQEYAEIIKSSSESLLVLINDILDISKIESNQLKIFNAPFEVNPVLEELSKFYRLRTENQLEIILETETDTKLFLNTDIVRFKQILTNLLNNAVKFTSKGFVSFGYETNGDTVIFYVKDSGIGIAENNIDSIFNYFEKIEDPRKVLFRGTGIGLAIAKSLVQMMGGKIWVKSQPKVGSSFFFSLPINKTNIASETRTLKNTTAQSSYNFDVVIVEDEEFNYQILALHLRKLNIDVLYWAKNGKDFIDFITKADSDRTIVTLMDIKMPKMNGIEAIQELKKINPTLPVVAITAFASPADKDDIMQHGFKHFLSKPINSQDLIDVLNKLHS